ncbi:peptidoglycan-binding protein [Sphingobacterium sp. N143]|uniref:CHAP domain-containing protein n=1 Tax=Sphingobacterium sp. N143 TaxID=2746727 RepID=UPI002578D457|nr:CHAP domain-containing protein [Sphingobacterium sp. N143]MDM1295285.1 peptidoglycan-binding protein [Sphingobacterium sp. N143]
MHEPYVGKSDRLSLQIDGLDLPSKGEVRNSILRIATAEIGVREEGGENRGLRVKEYLAYVGLGGGYPWCAAFVSWCYGQAGLPSPRTAWSPALFPKRRLYKPREISLGAVKTADLFAIYSIGLGRIHHVGLVKSYKRGVLVTVEGNSNDRVESRRRPLSTVYAIANWVG